MNSTCVEMDFDTWWDTYKPIDNPFQDAGTKQFETYGDEVRFVLNMFEEKPECVWTWVDGDDGTYLGNGFHYVNRIGYYITENPCEHEVVDVTVDKYGDYEEDN